MKFQELDKIPQHLKHTLIELLFYFIQYSQCLSRKIVSDKCVMRQNQKCGPSFHLGVKFC